MANFYTDNEDIKFQLGHPLMKKIVTLKETTRRAISKTLSTTMTRCWRLWARFAATWWT